MAALARACPTSARLRTRTDPRACPTSARPTDEDGSQGLPDIRPPDDQEEEDEPRPVPKDAREGGARGGSSEEGDEGEEGEAAGASEPKDKGLAGAAPDGLGQEEAQGQARPDNLSGIRSILGSNDDGAKANKAQRLKQQAAESELDMSQLVIHDA